MTASEATFFVTDVETNGPYPGVHSMLGFASVVCRLDAGIVDDFEVNLLPLPEMAEHPQVMAWLETEPEAYSYVTTNQIEAGDAMGRWVAWLEGFAGERIFVAHPISFDGMWMDWYLRRFADRPLFRGPLRGSGLFADAGLDLPTLAVAKLNLNPEEAMRMQFPADWLGGVTHSHRAIDDAKGYAHLLLRLLAM